MLKLKISNGTVTVNNGKLDFCVFCQDQTKLVLFMNWKPAPLINHPLTGEGKPQKLEPINKPIHTYSITYSITYLLKAQAKFWSKTISNAMLIWPLQLATAYYVCLKTYLKLNSLWRGFKCNFSAYSAINNVVKSIWAKHWLGRVAGVNWCASQQAGRQVVHIWRQRTEELHQCHANICLVHCRHVPNCGNKLIIFLCCAAGANVSEPIFVPGHTSLVLWLSAFGQQERSFFSFHRREEYSDPGISCLQEGGVITKLVNICTATSLSKISRIEALSLWSSAKKLQISRYHQ